MLACSERVPSQKIAQLCQSQFRLGVIRALLVSQFWRPSELLQKHIDARTTVFSDVKKPMIIVHARRTDQAGDGAALLLQETLRDPKGTLVVLARLIRAAERMSGLKFA